MSGQKAQGGQQRLLRVGQRIGAAGKQGGFYVGVVDFAEDARIANPVNTAGYLAGTMSTISVSSWTNITAGLQQAINLLQSPLPEQDVNCSFLRPVVILLSDGQHNVGNPPELVASQLKEMADLVTIAFGSDADEALLCRLATSPKHFYRCRDGRELRQFLAAVGKTLKDTLKAGVNATDPLTLVKK
ncbi:MAG: VWA domain-containing protein [bacterium]|nr:VWA domain-containing protein [bacterium]